MGEILITGSNGLLGSAIVNKLDKSNVYTHTRENCDLTKKIETDAYFSLVFDDKHKERQPDTIIHCAAKVGGINANMNNNKKFFEDNLLINRNVLDNAYRYKVKNLVSILSTCIFPDDSVYPLTSDKIDSGLPHDSNYGYSYSKRLLRYETDIYRNMTNNNWISIICTNLYGVNDNFNLDNSHLIPALIHKGYESMVSGDDFIIWGDGTPLRQFVFADDMADIILWSIDNWSSSNPLMAINEKEYSINDVVEIIQKRFDIPNNKIKYDLTKPNGQHRKPAKSDIPDWNFISLEDGINKTIDWYLKNLDKIRK